MSALLNRSTVVSSRDPGEPPRRRLPAVVTTLGGGALASIVAIGWIAFGYNHGAEFSLLIASVFATVAVGLPILLWRASRRRTEPEEPSDQPAEDSPGLLGSEFETHTGPLSGRAAVAQILLPVMAAAIGFVLIAMDFTFVHS